MLTRAFVVAVFLTIDGWASPAQAQPPAGSTEQELALRFQSEMARLKSFGPQAEEYARELQKQYDAYLQDAKAREMVKRETEERIAQAREAFDRYYRQLIAEGQAEGAERMKKLFEISLLGAQMAAEETPAQAGPGPRPDAATPLTAPAAPAPSPLPASSSPLP